jgi:hypothetical protein
MPSSHDRDEDVCAAVFGNGAAEAKVGRCSFSR